MGGCLCVVVVVEFWLSDPIGRSHASALEETLAPIQALREQWLLLNFTERPSRIVSRDCATVSSLPLMNESSGRDHSGAEQYRGPPSPGRTTRTGAEPGQDRHGASNSFQKHSEAAERQSPRVRPGYHPTQWIQNYGGILLSIHS